MYTQLNNLYDIVTMFTYLDKSVPFFKQFLILFEQNVFIETQDCPSSAPSILTRPRSV